ncbi:MAG: PAS domain-containing protein [Bacillaceae bacterium]|nr:PAS domain-containing protein [Bacillaceae bacterium]
MFIEGPTIIFKWNYSGEDSWAVEYVSDNITQLGFSKKQFEDKKIKYTEIIYQEDCERVMKEAINYINSGVSSFEQEYRIVSAEGVIKWVYDFTKVHRDEDGVITHVSGYVIDVYERVNVKKSLQDTLKKYTDIKYALERSSILSITDRYGNFTYVNDKFVEICKYKNSELIGSNYTILDPDNSNLGCFSDDVTNVVLSNEVWEGEVEHRAKDGSHFWLYTTIVPFLDEDNEPFQFVSIQYDITERKKSEEIIKRMDKLSVIGELAAGIAHEIRNPLTTIKGFTKFLRQEIKTESRDFVDVIESEIDRINFIVSEFMTLAKPHMLEQKEHKFSFTD